MPKVSDSYLKTLTAAVSEAKANLAARETYVLEAQKSLEKATEQRATATTVLALLEDSLREATIR